MPMGISLPGHVTEEQLLMVMMMKGGVEQVPPLVDDSYWCRPVGQQHASIMDDNQPVGMLYTPLLYSGTNTQTY